MGEADRNLTEQLSEQLAFAERDRDRLQAEVAELTKQLLVLERRLSVAEASIKTLTGRVGELADRGTERPPHAAGAPSDDVT